jgi:hypothetical protein
VNRAREERGEGGAAEEREVNPSQRVSDQVFSNPARSDDPLHIIFHKHTLTYNNVVSKKLLRKERLA